MRCELMLCQTLIAMAVNWLAPTYKYFLMLISVESAPAFAEGVVELQERFTPLRILRSALISNQAAATEFCSPCLLSPADLAAMTVRLAIKANPACWRHEGHLRLEEKWVKCGSRPLLLMKSGSYLQRCKWCRCCRKWSSFRRYKRLHEPYGRLTSGQSG